MQNVRVYQAAFLFKLRSPHTITFQASIVQLNIFGGKITLYE